MTPRTRKLLFYLLAFMFVIAGGSAIFYSQGWRINFSEWKLERTGAIFVKSIPRDAAITLDNQPIKNQTGLLENGTLIDGLLPHTYTLHLEKTGFFAWDKRIEVLPELVSKYEQIVLVPIREAVAIKKATAPNSIATTLIFDTQKNSYLFTDNSTPNKKTTNVSALFKTLRLSQLRLSSAASLHEALISPSDPNTLILLTKESMKGGVYVLNIKTSLLQKISSDSPSALALSTREVVWSTPKGLVIYNFSTTTTLPFASSTGAKKITLSPNGDKLGLLEKNTLSVFDRSRGTLILLATSTSDFEFSPDNQKVVIIKPSMFVNSIVIYDFEKQKIAASSPTLPEDYGSTETLKPSIHSVVWYRDSAHLFLIAGTDIFFSEIDASEPLNIRKIAIGITLSPALRNSLHLNPYTALNELDASKSVFYHSKDNTLYFPKGNTLFGFSFEESVPQ